MVIKRYINCHCKPDARVSCNNAISLCYHIQCPGPDHYIPSNLLSDTLTVDNLVCANLGKVIVIRYNYKVI